MGGKDVVRCMFLSLASSNSWGRYVAYPSHLLLVSPPRMYAFEGSAYVCPLSSVLGAHWHVVDAQQGSVGWQDRWIWWQRWDRTKMIGHSPPIPSPHQSFSPKPVHLSCLQCDCVSTYPQASLPITLWTDVPSWRGRGMRPRDVFCLKLPHSLW